MDDRTLYATILGIASPWEVARVELDDAAKAVHVWLEARSGTTFPCPECQTISPLHDHVERSWRHLDTCQYETRLHARVPRVDCTEHGVKTVPVPWATAHSRFTMLFERLAIAWLKEATPAAVAGNATAVSEDSHGCAETFPPYCRCLDRGQVDTTACASRCHAMTAIATTTPMRRCSAFDAASTRPVLSAFAPVSPARRPTSIQRGRLA